MDVLMLRTLAWSLWKYTNVLPAEKTNISLNYLLVSPFPSECGSRHTQINKYRTPTVENLVNALEAMYDLQKEWEAGVWN